MSCDVLFSLRWHKKLCVLLSSLCFILQKLLQKKTLFCEICSILFCRNHKFGNFSSTENHSVDSLHWPDLIQIVQLERHVKAVNLGGSSAHKSAT